MGPLAAADRSAGRRAQCSSPRNGGSRTHGGPGRVQEAPARAALLGDGAKSAAARALPGAPCAASCRARAALNGAGVAAPQALSTSWTRLQALEFIGEVRLGGAGFGALAGGFGGLERLSLVQTSKEVLEVASWQLPGGLRQLKLSRALVDYRPGSQGRLQELELSSSCWERQAGQGSSAGGARAARAPAAAPVAALAQGAGRGAGPSGLHAALARAAPPGSAANTITASTTRFWGPAHAARAAGHQAAAGVAAAQQAPGLQPVGMAPAQQAVVQQAVAQQVPPPAMVQPPQPAPGLQAGGQAMAPIALPAGVGPSGAISYAAKLYGALAPMAAPHAAQQRPSDASTSSSNGGSPAGSFGAVRSSALADVQACSSCCAAFAARRGRRRESNEAALTSGLRCSAAAGGQPGQLSGAHGAAHTPQQAARAFLQHPPAATSGGGSRPGRRGRCLLLRRLRCRGIALLRAAGR